MTVDRVLCLVAGAAIMGLVQVCQAIPCPDDYEKDDGGRCYKVYDMPMPMRNAQETCANEGGNLVTIQNNRTNNITRNIMSSNGLDSFWLGATLETPDQVLWRYTGDQMPIRAQGCYALGDEVSATSPEVSLQMTHARCIDICTGHTYATLRYGDTCECFNNYDGSLVRDASSGGGSCNIQCTGSDDTNPDNCGGNNHRYVLRTDGEGFDMWARSQPNNWAGYQTCAALDAGRRNLLNDMNCWEPRYYICQDSNAVPIITRERKSWQNARQDCIENYGGDLAQIPDEAVWQSLITHRNFTSGYYYVGLASRFWRWNNDGADAMRWSNWSRFKPSNRNFNCVTMNRFGAWNEEDCTRNKHFICEIEAESGEIGGCIEDFCLNGGECVEEDAGPVCICAEGFTGSNCEREPPNPCTLFPCANGVCRQTSSGYTCSCSPGYLGLNCETDCRTSLTAASGTFASPNHPSDYPHGVECSWRITVDPGKTVHLTFQTFYLEQSDSCSLDSVTIYENLDETSEIRRVCGNEIPDPVTSADNTMLVVFRSDGSISWEGFQIMYDSMDPTQIPSVPTNPVPTSTNNPTTDCVVELVASYGTFTSPNHPESYPHGLYCSWYITVPQGSVVLLTFNVFSLESCPYDAVTVYGDHDMSTTLGSFCGTGIPDPVSSYDNTMLVVFRSDVSFALDGFNATFRAVDSFQTPPSSPSSSPSTETIPPTTSDCGEEFTSAAGTFTSPNHPDNYPDGLQCSWYITVPQGSAVRLSFDRFSLESGRPGNGVCVYDSLMVYDDQDETDLLGSFCGNVIPGPITSNDNTMLVVFTSDSSVHLAGFSAVFDTVDISQTPSPSSSPSTPTTECGAVFMSEPGAFWSPNYPDNYPNGLQCSWFITVPQGSVVRLTFISFNLQSGTAICVNDALTVFDGHDRAVLLGRFCGNVTPYPVISYDNTMEVVFETDGSINRGGFSAVFDAVDNAVTPSSSPSTPSTDCGEEFTSAPGSFTSPNHPDNYPDGLRCYWYITLPQGSAVRLSFTSFNLEEGINDCVFDSLTVYDDREQTALLGSFCGDDIPGPITSNGNTMLVIFDSDGSQNFDGFSATFDTVDISVTPSSSPSTPSTGSCGGYLVAHNGSFSSPNHPDDYPHGSYCSWFITVAPGSTVRLTFEAFELEGGSCSYDSVTVYGAFDGTDLIDRLCGRETPGPIMSSDNTMLVVFESDGSINYDGFSATYTTVTSTVGSCGGHLMSSSGSLSSPNHPNDYPHGSLCSWFITVAPGSAVQLTFATFILEDEAVSCSYDSVTIYDAFDETGLIGRFCGEETPGPIVSSDNTMLVVFESDGSIALDGFSATYATVGPTGGSCGDSLTSSSGSFSSPNHPSNYPENSECMWFITVDPDFLVELSFDRFHLEYEDSCTFDSVRLYENLDRTGEIIRLCGENIPAPVISAGNTMLVVFRSDSSVAHEGFSASYTSRDPLACGGVLSAQVGKITSPSYPGVYNPDEDCIYTIQTLESLIIELTVADFRLEESADCSLDYLEIRDGGSASAPLLGLYCGTTIDSTLMSRGNQMYLHFHTNGDQNFRGFNITYNTILECTSSEFACAHGRNCISEHWICDDDDDCGDGSDEQDCPCEVDEFRCADGTCMHETNWCDGDNDCSDGSDEPPNCRVCVVECAPNQHQCSAGECISGSLVCDGVVHCDDLSDESNCPCEESRCANGLCIPHAAVCNRRKDCADNSDEMCEPPCNDGFFQCDGRCLHEATMCDGVFNCVDKTDENNCEQCSPARDYVNGDFATELAIVGRAHCNDGLCIDVDQWCDGVVHCFDQSDEFANCKPGCPPGSFECGNGQCVHYNYRCDMQPDCDDHTDEIGCGCPPDKYVELMSMGVTFPQGYNSWTLCDYGLCVPDLLVCDSQTQCLDGTDERQCQNCGGDQFACDNGMCVNAAYQCDGDNDCGDLSDERGCPCGDDKGECAAGVCLQSHYFCDGRDNCGDGSDEENCPCEAGELSCKNGKCYRSSQQCNAINDCGDWSDEKSCTCSADEFRCGGSVDVCLPNRLFCDRKPDCPDKSDELPNCAMQCPGDGFSCDGRCFEGARRCDGIINCGDFSDEANCQCPYYQFDCGNGQCVSSTNWCEGAVDCLNGNDEQTQCENNCPSGYGLCADDGQCLHPVKLCLGLATCVSFSLAYDCDAIELPEIKCGVPSVKPTLTRKLIFGGEEAVPHSFPWQCSLHYAKYQGGDHVCGGSIIDQSWVVTASHCVEDDADPTQYTIVVGEHDRRVDEGTEQRFSVLEIIMHENYDNIEITNDIALLRLGGRIQYSDIISPICLTSRAAPAQAQCITTGWGDTLGLGQATEYVLNQATVPIVAQDTCVDWYSALHMVTPDMICAGTERGESGACVGDSGGPLVCENGGMYTLQGITSWVKAGCKNPRAPTVYNRVTDFLDWIESHTGELLVRLD